MPTFRKLPADEVAERGLDRIRRRQSQIAAAIPEALLAFGAYIHFESVHLEENRRRFFCVEWRPLLFGGGALVCTWGRIGSDGESQSTEYADRESAQEAVEALIRRRLCRGYRVIASA